MLLLAHSHSRKQSRVFFVLPFSLSQVAITLQQTSGSELLPCDIYVLTKCSCVIFLQCDNLCRISLIFVSCCCLFSSAAPGQPLSKKNLAIHTNAPTSSKLQVVYATLKASDAPFIIMPVTSDPNQHCTFQLRVLSPLKDIYDVRPL